MVVSSASRSMVVIAFWTSLRLCCQIDGIFFVPGRACVLFMATFWTTSTLDLPWSPAFCPPWRPWERSELQNVMKTNGFLTISKSPKGPPEISRDSPRAPAKHPQAPQAPAMERQGPPKGPPRVPRDPQGPPHDAQGPPRDPKDLPRDLQEAPRDLQGPPRIPKGPQRPSKGLLAVNFGTATPLSMARPGGMRGAIKYMYIYI